MYLLYIHVAAICVAVSTIIIADHEVFGWIFGEKEVLARDRMRGIHWTMWGALLTLIGTGFFMFLPTYEYLLTQPLFILKLLFVMVLVVNAVLIGNLMEVALTRPFATLSFKEKMRFFVSGAISTFSWASTIGLGLYLFYRPLF